MNTTRVFITLFCMIASISGFANDPVSAEIDKSVWGRISQTVVENDIVGMAEVYHPDAVLVTKSETYPIENVLSRWGEDMGKMQEEGSKAEVSFKFRHRQDNDETSFESGIFRYVLTDSSGTEQVSLVAFEALLVKMNGQWKITMERQIREVDEADWSSI